jgi:RNA polymerase sigma-70 factor (ECF subfamily)
MTNQLRRTITGDEPLVQAALRGDTSAFGALVERYWNMIFALALTRIGDPVEAEDVAQESFIKAYSQLYTLRKPSRFAGWLSKIALQQSTNSVRRTIRCKTAFGYTATSVEQLDQQPAQVNPPGLTDSQIHFIRHAVARMPEKFRQLVIMRFVAGLSAVQIAEKLGKRPGTIRVWLHRAYNILRKDLAPLLEEVES